MKKYMASINLLLLLFIISFFQISHLFGRIHVEAQSSYFERDTLLSFKQNVGDPQNSLSNWTKITPHCTWSGVSCFYNDSTSTGQVRLLNLANLGLTGFLPVELCNLTSLQILDLSMNSFHGSILGSISNCRNLEMILLQVNKFTGSIPREIGYMSELQVLDFSVNNLTSVIPKEFGNLSSLIYIAMARNQLYGQIPREFGHMQNLQKIQLFDNELTGEIPDSIFNISSLAFISFSKNNLSGTLPTNIGLSIPNLTSLYLTTNSLEGEVPKSLSNISSLQFLELFNNKFRGHIPPYFGTMKKLTYLKLGINAFSSNSEHISKFLNSLKNCTQLQVVWINDNNLSGEFSSSFVNLSSSLQDVCIAQNLFTGTFPIGIDSFPNLISLAMENNRFTGKLPNSLSALTKLQSIALFANMFSGEIPDVFSNMKQLYSLELDRNRFSGRIPRSIADCKTLNRVFLSTNRLNGSIPREIFLSSGLVYLNLSQNDLRGPLPSEVGNLKQLTNMDISNNQLSGNLSSSLGGCVGLQKLSLARNKFTGPIPKSIVNLASLEELDLSSNYLTSQIPEELASLQLLQKLNLSFNHLEGKIPITGVFKSLGSESLRGNNKLCSANKETASKLGVSQCIATKTNKNVLVIILFPISISILLIIVTGCLVWILIYRKRKKNEGEKVIFPSIEGLPVMISYSNIRQATVNFAAENLIGKGAFGSVYKGIFSRGTFAVKVLDLEQKKAEKSFESECEALKSVRHRNLVKVITACSSIDHGGSEFKALVMDYMTNGNLDQWLYPEVDGESSMSLTLLQRLSIAIDIACAMDYLHNDCEPPIVHCDLKPTNVLLDDDMVAHVGDFGLARFLTQNQSLNGTSTIGLKGSIGYIAPEYGLGGRASTSGDVYSYGILLLELFIAKHPIDAMFKEGLNLINFASSVNDITEIADPRLFNEVESSLQSLETSSRGKKRNMSESNQKCQECVALVLRIGLLCSVPLAKDRLTMREALAKLLEIKKTLF